jgi:CRP-like cAMP-binding protein
MEDKNSGIGAASSVVADFLRQIPLLEGFSDADIESLSRITRGPIKIGAGETLFEEGAPSDSIYFILNGDFEVLKHEKDSPVRHRLALLGAGKSIGEVSLLDNGPRSGAVRAVTDGELLRVSVPDLLEHMGKELSAANRMKINLAYEMAARLRNTNETTVKTLREQLQEAERRVEMSKFISRLLIGLCLYMFALGVTSALSKLAANTSLISLPILAAFAFGVYRTVKTSPWPPSAYGFTLQNWRANALEGIVLTIPLAAVVVLAKWVAIKLVPGMAELRLFDLSRSTGWSLPIILLSTAAYCAFTPVQEIIARSGIQSSFQMFLTHKHRIWESIFLSNLLFSVTHLHVSLHLALLVFPLGLYWGWIYARQGSLVGSSVSHAILGSFAIFVVGFPGF